MKYRCIFSFRRFLKRREITVTAKTIEDAFSAFYTYLRDENLVSDIIPGCVAEFSVSGLKLSIFSTNLRE